MHEVWAQMHRDVIERLDGISETFSRAAGLELAWAVGTEGGHEGALAQLAFERRTVHELELVMPVVSLMKSGKSTIINAVVGRDLLPWRATAMTALPTKIVPDEAAAEPSLILTAQDAAAFTELAGSMAGHVAAAHDELADEYPLLRQVLDQLADGRIEPVPQAWRGRAAVSDGLRQLNDTVRLAALSRPADDFVGRLTELPTLRTAPWIRPEFVDDQVAGTLAMVDTPGIDDPVMGEHLLRAVATQLKDCHVVLLILDFTALGRRAEESIRALIEPVVQEIGREKLYVVVNKVDQRNLNDPGPDEVRRFVQHDLQLLDGDAASRIFETRGHEAFVAACVLSQYPWTDTAARIKDTDETKLLLNVMYRFPDEQQQALSTWTEQDLRTRANKLWEDSGLPELLTDAVGQLRASAVPVVSERALRRARLHLISLRDVARLRLKAARDVREQVEGQIAALRKEIVELEEVRAAAPDAQAIGDQIGAGLAERLKSLSLWGLAIINGRNADVGGEETAQRAAKDISRLNDRLRVKLGRLWHRDTDGAPGGGYRRRADGLLEFSAREAATQYIDQLTASAIQGLQIAADLTRDDMNREVRELARALQWEQNQKVRPILERAADRLRKAFDLPLTLPEVELSDDGLEVELLSPSSEDRIDSGVRTRTEMRRPWYLLWLIKVPVTVTEPYKTVTQVYTVDPKAITTQLLAGFDDRLTEIGEQVRQYTVEQLILGLHSYFTAVDGYLRRYMESLEQGLADASQSGAEQAEIAGRLSGVVEQADQQLDAVGRLRARIKG
jgi:hypothetical protein